jgi:hypothetical protein
MQSNRLLDKPVAGSAKRAAIGLLLVFLCGPLPLHAAWTLLDGARVHPDYHGPVPNKSDVIFSTRFKRPEAPAVIKSFGATRVEWVYSTDADFVQSIRSVVPWFGGAVSSTIPLPKDEGIAKDVEGQPIVAPWMKSWGAKWITTTDPRARRALENRARRYIELGARSIQVDDPLLQYATANWAGDFSESTLEGFRKYLSEYSDKTALQRLGILDTKNFNYKEFLADVYGVRTKKQYEERFRSLPTTPLWLEYLKESVFSHFSDFRRFLNAINGETVPLSMNLLLFGPDESKPQFGLVPFLDYAMVESRISDFDVLSQQAATYRALGVGHVPSIFPRGKSENRTAIAMLYALGAQPLVPWDVYINSGPDHKPSRFFGSPEDYADLYRFVRNSAEYLDNFEELAVVGIVVPVNRYQEKEVLELIRRLSKVRVPYALVPVGGTKRIYRLDLERVRHFRLLLTVNPDADFSTADMSSLRELPMELLRARDVSDKSLAKISPFWGDRIGEMHLVARGPKEGTGKIVLHVIRPTKNEDKASTTSCAKGIGIRRDALAPHSIKNARWRSLKEVRDLPIGHTRDGVSLVIPDCQEWGLLELTLDNWTRN